MQGLQNWDDLELCAHELAQLNNKSIWMDKYDNAEEIISTNPITNCIGIEHYNIGCEFHIKLQSFFLSLSTIPCIIPKKIKLIPNVKFYSQFRKLNKEQCAIYDDYMYRKRMYPNQPIHFFFTRGTNTSKTFTLLTQGLLKHYNKQLCYDPLKQKTILMAYISKKTINIDGITIHLIEPSIKL